MNDSGVSRRRFILSAVAAYSVLASPQRWLPGNLAWADTPELSALSDLARRLFPHTGLADEVFAEVAESVFAAFTANPNSAQLLDVAGSALDANANGDWFAASEKVQLEALGNIQNEAFFGAILAGFRGTFYYHPAVWAELDYPGSSKEHGGYIHRGFDDISWLPEVN